MRHARLGLWCLLAAAGCGDASSTSDGPVNGGDGGGVVDLAKMQGNGDLLPMIDLLAPAFDSGCAFAMKMCANVCVAEDPAHGCGGGGCAACPAAPANAVADCAAGACSFTCNAGFGDCNNNPADGCEQDVSKDAANCGSCGFACPQGANCVAGACQLVMPGMGSDQACLTIDATTIYWATANANPGAVYSIPKNGGNPTQIIAGAKGPRGVAVDATSIYFTTITGGEVMKCPLAGCGNGPTLLATGQSSPFSIVVDAKNVYWTDRMGGDVMQCAVGGCNMAPTKIASGQIGPWDIAVDATNVYWSNSGDGTLMSTPIGGGAVTQRHASGMPGARGIALDANAVYYAQSMQGQIFRVPLNGGNVTVAGLSKNPWSLAVDATDLFWTNSAGAAMGGAIDKFPLSGIGAVTQRAANQPFPLCIAVDATTVYWIDAGGNTVQKAAK